MPAREEPGFDTSLDWGDLDRIGADEAQRIEAWYESSHGEGSLELTPFVPFLLAVDPGALKRYRRFAQTAHEEGGLPQLAVALLFLHLYMALGYGPGVRYQVIAARTWGATRQEVLDTVRVAFASTGPLGASTVADHAADLLEAWPADAPRAVADPWPAGWAPGGAAARTGAGIEALIAAAPATGAMWRSRIEHAQELAGVPTQMLALYAVHGCAARGRVAEAAAAAGAAREAGIGRCAVLEAIWFAALYLDAFTLDRLGLELAPILEGWD
jgi:alkylhydroperoxidase/carboxymuconolactone decarboxylase family protein YurZ